MSSLKELNRDDIVKLAVATTTVTDVKAVKLTKAELSVVADDLDTFIQTAGDQDNDWCVLDELEIIKAHFAVRTRHGSVMAKKYFVKQFQLFQEISKKIKIVAAAVDVGVLPDNGKSFFDASKQMCTALKEYTLSLYNAVTVKSLDKAFIKLKRVYDDIFVVEYDLVKPSVTASASAASGGKSSISSVFGVIKWVIRYWTMMYLIGAFMYNVYYYSELFAGGESVLDFCMTTFGCICLAFVGSAAAATKVSNHALAVIGAIIQSTVVTDKAEKADTSKSAFLGVIRYLGTAFLSGWIVSVSRCICLITTRASRFGLQGAVWDSIYQVGWKAWTSVVDATVWVNNVVADNGRALFVWFLKFTNDVVWKRFMSGVSAFIGHATGTSGAVTTALALTSKSTSTLISVIKDQTSTALVDTTTVKALHAIEKFTDFMSELKYSTVNTDMTGVVQSLAIQDLTEFVEAKPPEVGYVRNLINKGLTSLTTITLLVLVIMFTQIMLIRGV